MALPESRRSDSDCTDSPIAARSVDKLSATRKVKRCLQYENNKVGQVRPFENHISFYMVPIGGVIGLSASFQKQLLRAIVYYFNKLNLSHGVIGILKWTNPTYFSLFVRSLGVRYISNKLQIK